MLFLHGFLENIYNYFEYFHYKIFIVKGKK